MHKLFIAMLVSAPLIGCVDNTDTDTLGVETSELSQSVQQDIHAAREATKDYRNFDNAVADGFVNTGLPCIEGQGFHYIRPDLLGTNDVTLPHVLMYAPKKNGTLELIALEWITPIADATTQAPTLFGEVFHGPNTVEGIPFQFFGLHVWAWEHNKNGVFADTNPKVHCP